MKKCDIMVLSDTFLKDLYYLSKVYTLFDFFKDFERSLMLSKAAFIKKRTLILSNIHVKFQLSN